MFIYTSHFYQFSNFLVKAKNFNFHIKTLFIRDNININCLYIPIDLIAVIKSL